MKNTIRGTICAAGSLALVLGLLGALPAQAISQHTTGANVVYITSLSDLENLIVDFDNEGWVGVAYNNVTHTMIANTDGTFMTGGGYLDSCHSGECEWAGDTTYGALHEVDTFPTIEPGFDIMLYETEVFSCYEYGGTQSTCVGGANNDPNSLEIIYGSALPPLTTRLTLPSAGESLTLDQLSYWNVAISNPTSSDLDGYTAGVFYGSSSPANASSTFYDVASINSATVPPGATTTVPIRETTGLPTGTWYAAPFLYSSTTGFLIGSTTSFIIYNSPFTSPTQPPVVYYPAASATSTPTTTLAEVDCSDQSGLDLYLCDFVNWWQTSINSLVAYWFEPSQQSLNQFANIGSEINDKVPFGYLPLILGDLSGLNASSTPIATSTEGIADISIVISPVDDLISLLLAIALIWWIVHKVGNIQL